MASEPEDLAWEDRPLKHPVTKKKASDKLSMPSNRKARPMAEQEMLPAEQG